MLDILQWYYSPPLKVSFEAGQFTRGISHSPFPRQLQRLLAEIDRKEQMSEPELMDAGQADGRRDFWEGRSE